MADEDEPAEEREEEDFDDDDNVEGFGKGCADEDYLAGCIDWERNYDYYSW